MVLAAAAPSCTLLMPSDDELRGRGGSSAGGSGGSAGVSGGGGFPSGGNSGQAGCAQPADFTHLALPSAAAARDPWLAFRAATSDLALTFVEAGDVTTRAVALDGSLAGATKLSSSGQAKELSAAFSAGASVVGATWFDTSLMFGAHPPTSAKALYGSDPSLPAGKSPSYAAIAAAPVGPGFGIVWSGYGDSARRLYALAVDASGTSLTPGDGYTRITDETSCGDRNHPTLVTTADGFAIAWSWAPKDCAAASGGEPDIYFTTLDAALSAPVSKLTVAAGAGVSDWPRLATNGTDFGLVWQDDRDGTNAVWFARVAGAGVVSGSLVRVSQDAPSPGRAPAIAAGPAGYGVAWQSGSRVHFSVIGGGAEPADAVLAEDALAGETPSVVWAKDRWAVAWTRGGSKSELWLSQCTP